MTSLIRFHERHHRIFTIRYFLILICGFLGYLPTFHSAWTVSPSFLRMSRIERKPREVTRRRIHDLHSQRFSPIFVSMNERLIDFVDNKETKRLINQSDGKDVPFFGDDDVRGLYVHIPFCRRRCRYCNFAIVPSGLRSINDVIADENQPDDEGVRGFQAMAQSYAQAVCTEIQLEQLKQQQNSPSERIKLQSIYFGGGTPSLAPLQTLQSILHMIRNEKNSCFQVLDDAEITIEIDPGTFTREKLQAIRDMGFNRISLGVQSFDDKILESLGRIHRSYDIYHSLELIKQVFGGKPNLSIDLISGLPGLSLAQWTESLHIAVNLDPRPVHLSLYDLQIENGTVFGKWYSNDDVNSPFYNTRSELSNVPRQPVPLPSEEDAAFMYKYASYYLRAKGYEHYEVSSYALLPWDSDNKRAKIRGSNSHRSRHNQIYWGLGSQWHAFGLGASSYINGRMIARPRTLFDYHAWVNKQALKVNEQNEPVTTDSDNEDYSTTDIDAMQEIILKRLRTSEGLSVSWIRNRFGEDYADAVLSGAQLGLDLDLAEFDEQHQVLRLAKPEGFLFSNSIISSIFVAIEHVKA